MTGHVDRTDAPAESNRLRDGDAKSADFTIGVEEEFLLVDPSTGRLVPRSARVVEGDREVVETEMHQALVETASVVCESIADLRASLAERRRRVAQVARNAGVAIVSAGAAPISDSSSNEITETERFRKMLDDYQVVAIEQTICSTQTHVGFVDRDESVEVMNRVRAWLPPLLAMSASSPYHRGADTGYDSYRIQVWARWPTSGMPTHFASWRQYQQVMQSLVDDGAIDDVGMLYWWARPSQHVPTLELRIADAATTVDEAVMIAALSRAVTIVAAQSMREGRPAPAVRPEWLDVAVWRASRFGLSGELLDPVSGKLLPAHRVIEEMMKEVDGCLGDPDDAAVVLDTAERVMSVGNSASRQRVAFERRDRLEDVVEHLMEETVAGIDG